MTLSDTYAALLASENLNLDPAQLDVLRKLEGLSAELNLIANHKKSRVKRLFQGKRLAPRGLYIWGDVGRGKTMLMDLFFASITTPKKLRVHFHAFMQDVHARRTAHKSDDVIAEIAASFAEQAQVFCLDEMQIVDIADAMTVGRLFDALQARGVCIVTTANLPPDELYKDGLNRQLFLPFIAKLNSSLDVVHVGDGVDYRLGRLASRATYIAPVDKHTDAEINAIWADLTDQSQGATLELELLGRKLKVACTAKGCARFTFGDLCEKPLAAPDYLALAKAFRVIIIERVPIFKASQRNEAKRFIMMIDTFYDQKTRIIISAQAFADKLCNVGPYKAEFLRTASRLQEMQSAKWWLS